MSNALGCEMLTKLGIVCVALLSTMPLTRAQDTRIHRPPAEFQRDRVLNGGLARETLEADATRVALHRTFQGQAQPSRAELLSILMLMSLHERQPHPGDIHE